MFIPLLITGASATIYHQMSASMSSRITRSPVIFTRGEDTGVCGGSIGANATQATFTSIPLTVGSNITITQLVNITNIDSSDCSVQIFVSENFGPELSVLSLYVVSPSGTEFVVVLIDDAGNITTESVAVNVPSGEEWAMKLEGHYDAGTPVTQKNTMSLTFQVRK